MENEAKGGWRNYRPKKGTLVWSFLAGVLATLIVGFSLFDWHTAGGADNLADDAAARAKSEFAGAICVERFMTGQDAAARLAELKNEGKWDRDNYIEEGGWATFATSSGPLNQAAGLCADTLVEMQAPQSTAASG